MSLLDELANFFSDEHNDYFLNELNFSELVILASLGQRVTLAPTATNAPSFAPDCVFEANGTHTSILPYDKFKTKLLDGIDKSVPLTDKDIQAAFDLLTTGQVENDIKDTVLGMLNQIPGFPAQILTDIPNIFRDPTDFPRLPGFDAATKSINSIIRPDKAHPNKNRIFRLAILAYARMNGINLEEENLLDLSDFLASGTESDFMKLVEHGLETLKEQYGVTDFNTVVKQLHAFSQECMKKAKALPV